MKKLAIGLLIMLGISHSIVGFPGEPQNVLIYTKNGEGYVRLSLTIHDAGLVKGLSRLSGWRDSKITMRTRGII